MTKLILYLWLSGQMTNEKYQALKNYRRVFKRGPSWCERYLIADMPPELEKLDQELRERGE